MTILGQVALLLGISASVAALVVSLVLLAALLVWRYLDPRR